MDSPHHDRHPDTTPSHHDYRLDGNVFGTSIQAGAVHGDIHLTVPPPRNPPAPRQLPVPPAVYVDRDDEIARIDEAISGAHARGRNALIVITGPAGVGKSGLAAHFLHAHGDLGRQGQLYVDLRGFVDQGPPTDPEEVLQFLLPAMGIDPGSVPADLRTRAAWWRSATAQSRIVLLLDNALSAAQVRTLLPGGNLNTVIVTSRVHLAGLRLHGADFVDVPPLPRDDGVELLARLSGRSPDDRAERAAMHRVVDLCSGLPVAMCAVAVGESAHGRGSWTRVERDLQDSEARLSRLSVISEQLEEETSVRGAFDVSYGLLDSGQARLYRRLAWHPGPDFTARIVSCLMSSTEEEAESLLAGLARQAMLSEHSHGRYRFHDLLRLHSAAKARAEESAQAREHATGVLLDTFADLSSGADAVLRPYAGTPPAPDGPFTTPDQALAWLNAERENLAALTEHATGHGRPAEALRLVEGLWPFFLHHGHASLWLRAVAPAIAAARALGRRRAEGRLLNKRARGHRQLGKAVEALADLDQAEAVWRELGDLERIALTRQQRGALALQTGRTREAITYFQDTLAMDERTGDQHNMAVTLLMLGRSHLAEGLPERAISHLERALSLLEEDPYNQARTRVALGSALLALHRLGPARRELDTALETMRDRGSVSGQCEALEALGALAEAQGDPGTAQELYVRARDLLPPNDPARLRVERRLTGLNSG